MMVTCHNAHFTGENIDICPGYVSSQSHRAGRWESLSLNVGSLTTTRHLLNDQLPASCFLGLSHPLSSSPPITVLICVRSLAKIQCAYYAARTTLTDILELERTLHFNTAFSFFMGNAKSREARSTPHQVFLEGLLCARH